MRKLLTSLIGKEIVSIYMAPETESSWCGYVRAVDEDYVLLNCVDPNGLYDGYRVLEIDDITRIDYGGKYEKMIETLTSKKQSKKHSMIDIVGNDVLVSLLNHAMEHQLLMIAQLQGCDDTIPYFIPTKIGEVITGQIYDIYGQTDGNTCFLLEEIEELGCDSTTAQDIKLLME